MMSINLKNCTGCGLCSVQCPQTAISMVPDNEGFFYPQIDAGRCTECGLCDEACPVKADKMPAYGYAFRHNDVETLSRSASGGAFTALADAFWEKNPDGIVFGAAMDENLSVSHVGITKEQGTAALNGTKYVQTDITPLYKEIENQLSHRAVMFSGTPCQSAAISSYFGNREKLILVDVVCNGTASQKAFLRYLKNLEENSGTKAVEYAFRNYRYYKGRGMACRLADGSVIEKSHAEDMFCKLYMTNMISRPSCYACPFTTLKRTSDITLGDFHGLAEVDGEFSENRSSLIIPNTKKGEELVCMSLQAGISKKYAVEDCLQPRLTEPPKMPMLRKFILKDLLLLDQMSFTSKYGNLLRL